MLTGVFPVLGSVLLVLSLVASMVGSVLLVRGRRRHLAPAAASPAPDISGVWVLAGAAVLAASGAAALSDGTPTPAGCWPFAAALVVLCAPVLIAEVARRRRR